MKEKLLFLYDHNFKLPKEILVSYSRSTYVNVNTSFPNSNFEGNFSNYVFGKFFDIIDSRNVNVRQSDTYCEKKY